MSQYQSNALLCGLICLIASAHSQLIPTDSQQFFDLLSKVTINDVKHSSAEETSYIFRAHLRIESVWHAAKEQLLQVHITEPSVSTPRKGKLLTQEITKIPDRPFYISIVDGRPSKVIAHTSRDQSLLNLERGIASLLQLQRVNGPVSELDVSGQCNAFYDVKSTTRIEKTKTDCTHWDLRVNYRAEHALGVTQHSTEKVYFDLTAEGALLKATSEERHWLTIVAKPDVGSEVTSEFVLQHLSLGNAVVQQLNYDTLEEAIKSLLDWYRVFDIEADVDGVLSELGKDQTLKQTINSLSKELSDDHIGTQKLALHFSQLLPLARITKQPEFVSILETHKELHSQLVDLLGAVQTAEAHQAINAVFNYHEEQDALLLEKYLQALSIGTHPERAIIEDLFARVQDKENPINNEKLYDSLVQTIAALVRQSNSEPNASLIQDVVGFLLSHLESKCKLNECKTLFIRALQNLQLPSTVNVLLKQVLEGEAAISVAAMQALKSFPLSNFNEGHRNAFAEIFYQRKRKFDSSARTMALDILFALRPTKEQLEGLLDYLQSNDSHFEIKTYVVQKVRMLAEKCPRFSALLRACLSENPNVNNYHILAQKGLTTVLTRRLSQSPAFNESLLSVQEINKGVLKRGSVELLLHAGRDEFTTFKLGIYTNGLSSFVGDSDDEVDDEVDDSPTTAGMEISVQGVSLRPLVFFNGQAELMGHVWSGTASEPTSAFEATTLAHDHEHYVLLGSGATVYMRVIGFRSVDLYGKVQMSLWNRNANTEINQDSGTSIVGHTVAGFTYAKVENDFTLTQEPKLSLQADIDFYSGVKLCIQLQRPEMVLRHNNTKSVSLNATKPYKKRVQTSFSHFSAGSTLALNQKNNEMCNIIFN